MGGGRKSNIEMLRLVAMFLVMIVHADYFSLGIPTYNEIILSPTPSITRCFFESCSIICVNVFVLISGWFGIRPSMKGFGGFMFQCAYFQFGIFFFITVMGLVPFSIKGFASCFLLLGWDWFIKAYILLYILAPVLNAFIDNSDRKVQRMVVLAYFIFQSIYGWISHGATFIEDGYSTLSFIGLYILARYVHNYKPRFANKGKWADIVVILALVFVLTLTECLRIRFGIPVPILVYTNPIVIMLSIYVLFLFSKLSVQSKCVDWIAASSFAVFLFHANYNVCIPFYKEHIGILYQIYNGVGCVALIFIYIVIYYIAAILLDQPRKWIYNKFMRSKFEYIDSKYNQNNFNHNEYL